MSGTADRVQGVSSLDRRIIEIELTELFLEIIARRWGEEAAKETLAELVQKAAAGTAEKIKAGQPPNPGGGSGGTSGEKLAALYEVWKKLGAGGALDMELDELSDTVLRFHINHCGYAEAYRERGLEALGADFSCKRDRPFAEALIPGIKLIQSRTILEGARRCDFEYRLE